MRTRHRILGLLALTAAGLIVGVAPAQASLVFVTGTTVVYDASPGEANDVDFDASSALVETEDEEFGWVVFEEGPGVVLNAGSGCTLHPGNPGFKPYATCFASSGPVTNATVDLADGDDHAKVIPSFKASDIPHQNITISGGNGNDEVRGGLGNDHLNGDYAIPQGSPNPYTGDDHVVGGDGNDFIDGGNGADLLQGGNGRDTVLGNIGDRDTVDGGQGKDSISGGDGAHDKVIYPNRPGPVIVTLDNAANDGTGQEDDNVSADVEDIQGTPGKDQLHGSAGPNIISGLGGDDDLDGHGGVDTLVGGDGNDRLFGNGDAIGDFIDCSGGTANQAFVDLPDTVNNCQFVTRSPKRTGHPAEVVGRGAQVSGRAVAVQLACLKDRAGGVCGGTLSIVRKGRTLARAHYRIRARHHKVLHLHLAKAIHGRVKATVLTSEKAPAPDGRPMTATGPIVLRG